MTRGWRSKGSALVVLALGLAACGGGSGSAGDSGSSTAPAAVVSSSPGATVARKPGQLAGPLIVSPPTRASQIVLHDQNGKLFKLSSLRGKAVFLTFVYAHCPDVCPLMMQGLAAARRSLPDPSIMQIVAVSVDPKGDTPRVVKQFLRARELTGKARWLLGTRAQLRPVWIAYNIEAKSVPETPAIIEHVSLIYGIDARGRIRVGYPASPISPSAMAHDARILARAK
ncbi:MAG TPA: SCO family protein [Solirubrobacteraceae bacterium]|nr:SCO family protein [Solirubrobacteraceae bacterium]